MICKFIAPIIILAYFSISASFASGQVGIVLDCFGECDQLSKKFSRKLKYGRPVKLGETLVTKENSSLWIILYDGTLVRMASETIIEIKELLFHFAEKKSHVAAELHQGHVLFLPRTPEILPFSPDSFRELFPLEDSGANPFWDLYRYNETQTEILMSLKAEVFINYRKKMLSDLTQANNQWFPLRESHYTLYSPNVVVQSKGRPIDFIYSFDIGAMIGSRDDIEGIRFPAQPSQYYLSLDQYKSGKLDPHTWYQVIDNKKIKAIANDLGAKEYSLYFKSFPSILKARERFLRENQKKITAFSKTSPIETAKANYLMKIQKQPFDFKASVQKTVLNKSLIGLFNQSLFELNRKEEPILKEASLVKIFQTTNRQKREWLLKKELKDVREQNRKILLDFGKSKSQKKKTL